MVKAFEIASGPRVRFGRGEVTHIGEEAKGLGMAKPMFVTDPGLASSGALDSVIKGIEDASLDYQFYDQAEANPSDTSIIAARDFFNQNGCDGFIAAGGGSTMDTAKATLAIVANGGVPSDYYGRGKATKPGPPLITVPTTAGTGSEVTMSSIVTDKKLMIKTVLADDSLFARLTIVDSALLAKLPSHIAAGAMMDALTHAIESVGSPSSSPWTEALAFQSITYIGKHGRAYVDDPSDPEAADAHIACGHARGTRVHQHGTRHRALARASAGRLPRDPPRHGERHLFAARHGVQPPRHAGDLRAHGAASQ